MLVVAAMVFALAAAPRPNGWTDASVFATAQSVAERGALSIDDSAYLWQGARVQVGGRWYSSEPAVLGLVCAAPYALARAVLGVSIESAVVSRALVWVFVGLPVLLGLWSLGHLALAAGLRGRNCALAIAAIGFATLLLPYSLVLNPHAPAAGIAVAALLAMVRGRLLAAGVAAGLAAALDPGAGIALVVFAWPAARLGGVRGVVRYALGALPPMALAAGLSVAVFGDPQSASAHAGAFAYPLSPAALAVPRALHERVLAAAVGPAGMVSLFPLTVVALVAGISAAFRSRGGSRGAGAGAGERGLPTSIVGAVIVTAVVSFAWLAMRPIGPEPAAHGDRRTCAAAAMAMVGGVAWLGERWRLGRRMPVIARTGVGVVALWSVASAISGAAGPWTRFEVWPESDRAGASGLAEQWRREWIRVQSSRRLYTREGYDRAYCELMAGLADEAIARRTSLEAARGVLGPVAAELDRLGHQSESRWAAYYELARVCEAKGELELARKAYERTVYLYPRHGPAREAAERLARRTGAAGAGEVE